MNFEDEAEAADDFFWSIIPIDYPDDDDPDHDGDDDHEDGIEFIRRWKRAWRNISAGTTAAVVIGKWSVQQVGSHIGSGDLWTAVEIDTNGKLVYPDDEIWNLQSIDCVQGKINHWCDGCELHNLMVECARFLIGESTEIPSFCPYILEHLMDLQIKGDRE